MRNKYLSFIIVMLLLVGGWVQADVVKKTPLKVDFNAMINNTNLEKQNLEKSIGENVQKESSSDVASRKKSSTAHHQERVRHFIDGEIGWGKAPKMVDRRFDSVKEHP